MKALLLKIWGFIMSLFQKEIEQIKVDSKDKVVCRYNVIDDINKYAEGQLYFNNEIFKFISGKWGKGYAPKGKYKAYADQLKHSDEKPYSQFNFGWYLPIGPQFETERFGLMIHPDGGVEGTLGCIGLHFESLDENVRCYNLFRDYFDKETILNVEII